jgi:hypothetical protein
LEKYQQHPRTDEMDEKFVRSAVFLGLEVTGQSGDERICTCVACDKEQHMYWNIVKNVGYCQHCDESFTSMGLLDRLILDCQKDLTEDLLEELAKDRGLPAAAFESLALGYVDDSYILPIWAGAGTLASVRRYKLGEGLRWLGGCDAVLFGISDLIDPVRQDEPVYLCEGEWDAIALRWFLAEIVKEGVVVAVPGANTLKPSWPSLFRNRTVCLCYDNDEPGQDGANRAIGKLGSVAKALHTLVWPKECKPKYDIRDWICEHAIQSN